MNEMFLKITGPDVKGESVSDQGKDLIELLSWSHGVAMPLTHGAPSGVSVKHGRCDHQDLTISKFLDSTSPVVNQHVSGGTNFKQCVLTMYQADKDAGKPVLYYKIEIEDVISSISASTMIQRCFNGDSLHSNPTYDPNNFYCQLFDRDALSGNIINATSNNLNLAGLRTSGVDMQLDWRWDELPVIPGSVDLSYIVGWTEESSSQTSPGQPFNDSVGSIGTGLGSATPEWKWLLSTNYNIGPVRVGARWRYIGEMVNAGNTNEILPATSYYDLLGSWDVNDNVTLRVGINNVSDQQPRTYSPSIQANTDPSTYDTLGRRVFVGLNARF